MSSIFSTAESFFQCELQTYNNPEEAHSRVVAGQDGKILCQVSMAEKEDIIQNTSGYAVACTGWQLSSSESLVYQPVNETVWVRYGQGEYDEKTEEHSDTHQELRIQNRKSYNFADLMQLLEPSDEDLRCITATPSGSILIKNNFDQQHMLGVI